MLWLLLNILPLPTQKSSPILPGIFMVYLYLCFRLIYFIYLDLGTWLTLPGALEMGAVRREGLRDRLDAGDKSSAQI